MSVEDWARREADRIRREDSAMLTYDMEEDAFAAGIVHAFDALLTDEAIQAAKLAGFRALDGAEQIEDAAGNIWDIGDAISDALQAAVRAVTDPKTHDSSTTTTGEQ